jgi:hypothetical protein
MTAPTTLRPRLHPLSPGPWPDRILYGGTARAGRLVLDQTLSDNDTYRVLLVRVVPHRLRATWNTITGRAVWSGGGSVRACTVGTRWVVTVHSHGTRLGQSRALTARSAVRAAARIVRDNPVADQR